MERQDKYMQFYVHEVPGRLRVKIPTIKHNPAGADRVKDMIGGLGGVQSVAVTHVTGSVVAYFDSTAISSSDILSTLKQNGYFDDSRVITNEAYVKDAVSKAGQSVSRVMMSWLLGAALEDTGLGFLAALI